MATLLHLPSELRARIIEYVLQSPSHPLSNPFGPQQVDGIEYHDLQYRSWGGGSNISYKQPPHDFDSSACLPLLLTNHQTSADTKDVLSRLSKIDYMLDIAVKNDFHLFVTWLSVPCATSQISTLYTQIRLFGRIIPKEAVRKQLGDGGRHGFHWHFYSVLERLIKYGPVGLKKRSGEEPPKYRWEVKNFQDRQVFIKTLVLNFEADETDCFFPAADVAYDQWLARHWGRDQWQDTQEQEAFSSSKTRPEWLCKYLKGYIDGLLGMSYHYSEYGHILFERIGTIRMLVDGNLHSELNLSEILSEIQFTDVSSMMGHLPSDERESGFWKWKRETLQKRQNEGFPALH